MIIKWLSLFVGAVAFEAAGRYGRIAEYRYLHIFVFSTGKLGRFRIRQKFGFVRDFPVVPRAHKFVGQQWCNKVGIICLLGLKPLIFERCDRFLGTAAGLLSLRPYGASQRK